MEIAFRGGRPLAAYLYLVADREERSIRSEQHEGGLVVDFAADGRAIGVEITAPSAFSVEALNRVLAKLGEPPATQEDLAPLAAA